MPATAAVSWVLPGEPPAVRLMNTIWADRHSRHDSLRTGADLADWLGATGLTAATVRPIRRDLADARALRDALRRLAAEVTGDGRERAAVDLTIADAVAVVNRIAASAPDVQRLTTGPSGLRQESVPVRPVEGALAAVASAGIRLVGGGDDSLRACDAPMCVLYFVKDHPRREWCSVACGNRVRAARSYDRRRRLRD